MGASIKGFWNKIKDFTHRASESRETLPALLIVTVGLASFGLGRLSAPSMSPAAVMRVSEATAITPGTTFSTSTDAKLPPAEGYVASKNGGKYHLPWCSGAQRIADGNKVWFATKAEAEAAGYGPAENCKGI